jgi:DNA repair protein RadC
LRSWWNESTIELFEEFNLNLTNRANRVLGIVKISSGGMAGTASDPKLIFGAALKACASGIILSHNHPSENLSPSLY